MPKFCWGHTQRELYTGEKERSWVGCKGELGLSIHLVLRMRGSVMRRGTSIVVVYAISLYGDEEKETWPREDTAG